MTVNNGTADDDEMSAAESAQFSADPPEPVARSERRPSREGDRYRRSISGVHRDGRALGMSGSSIRRSSKSKGRDKIGRLRLIVAALLIALVFAAGTAILARNQKAALAGRVFTLDSQLRAATSELLEAREMLAAQEAELRSLVSGRLPDLSPLKLNTQIDLNREYLHSLTFMESGVGDAKQLEYLAILKNSGTDTVSPQIKIILFDSKGIQTGATRIGEASSTAPGAPAAPTTLEPGETRSYTAVLEKPPEIEYAYFMVEVN